MLLIWWNVHIVVSQLNSNAKSKQQKNTPLTVRLFETSGKKKDVRYEHLFL